MYTAEELSRMTSEELERLAMSVSNIELPSIEILRTMDVGVYDENGHLIGEKPGGEYEYEVTC